MEAAMVPLAVVPSPTAPEAPALEERRGELEQRGAELARILAAAAAELVEIIAAAVAQDLWQGWKRARWRWSNWVEDGDRPGPAAQPPARSSG